MLLWKASDACKASCDTCDDGSQPVAAPQTDVPTSSPITSPTAVSCSDDPIWHGKMNEAHTCSFVALEPERLIHLDLFFIGVKLEENNSRNLVRKELKLEKIKFINY